MDDKEPTREKASDRILDSREGSAEGGEGRRGRKSEEDEGGG